MHQQVPNWYKGFTTNIWMDKEATVRIYQHWWRHVWRLEGHIEIYLPNRIDDGTMFWTLNKKKIVSLSMTESEHVAMHTTKEVLWLCWYIGEVLIPFHEPIVLFSDNQSAITLTKNYQYHMCTKYINICFHFVCWIVDDRKIHLVLCPTNNMVANKHSHQDAPFCES